MKYIIVILVILQSLWMVKSEEQSEKECGSNLYEYFDQKQQKCKVCDIENNFQLINNYYGEKVCECVEDYILNEETSRCQKCLYYKKECYLTCPQNTKQFKDYDMCIRSNTIISSKAFTVIVSSLLSLIFVVIVIMNRKSIYKFFVTLIKGEQLSEEELELKIKAELKKHQTDFYLQIMKQNFKKVQKKIENIKTEDANNNNENKECEKAIVCVNRNTKKQQDLDSIIDNQQDIEAISPTIETTHTQQNNQFMCSGFPDDMMSTKNGDSKASSFKINIGEVSKELGQVFETKIRGNSIDLRKLSRDIEEYLEKQEQKDKQELSPVEDDHENEVEAQNSSNSENNDNEKNNNNKNKHFTTNFELSDSVHESFSSNESHINTDNTIDYQAIQIEPIESQKSKNYRSDVIHTCQNQQESHLSLSDSEDNDKTIRQQIMTEQASEICSQTKRLKMYNPNSMAFDSQNDLSFNDDFSSVKLNQKFQEVI